MPNFGMAEKYGYPVTDISSKTQSFRREKSCPFTGRNCSKKSGGGVCSLTDGHTYPIVCPERFKQNSVMYNAIAKQAFGSPTNYAVLSEVPFLRSHQDGLSRSAGNIDNILVKLDENDQIVDWCALEVQAVYFSGTEMGPEVKAFEKDGTTLPPASRRPDFRSSGPKRLLPQLEIKVPTLRRWGKKMFVAIDKPFFDWLPQIQAVDDISNADICWISFKLETSSGPYQLTHDKTVLATLEDSRTGLVAGISPPKSEFEADIEDALASTNKKKNKVIYKGKVS